jgi:hypothetical protein
MKAYPWKAGERLEYRVDWGVFHVGDAVIKTARDLYTDDGALDPCIRIGMTVRSFGLLNAIYPVRDAFESCLATDLSRTTRYRKVQTGASDRDTVVTFDYAAGTVQYTDRGESLDPVPLPGPAFDPFGIVFKARSLDFEEGKTLPLLATDGKKVSEVDINVVGRETLKTPAGTFEAWLVEPDMKELSLVFKKADGAKVQIWYSADDRRLPLRLRSEIAIGAFDARLTGIGEMSPEVDFLPEIEGAFPERERQYEIRRNPRRGGRR